ncbi:MAG: alpha/beta fold hydrolase [Actinobacteria bacterium]|nr:alpha/beta fold hydrolase [Actinomycetota bacterium]
MAAELRETWVETAAGGLRALEAGDGPAVVLLHGSGTRGGPLPGPADLWRPLAGRLSGEHRVVALDLPGVGGSAADEPRRLSSAGAIEAVGEVLTKLGLGDAHLVAHDEAGLAALEATRSDPRIVSCTLIAPAAIIPAGDRQMNLALINRPKPHLARRSLVWTARRLVGDELCLDADLFDLLEREANSPHSRVVMEMRAGARAQIELTEARALTALYARVRDEGVTVPVAIIWGVRDPLSSFERAMLLHTLLSGGACPPSIHAMARCGHLPHLEAPAACAAIIRGQVRAGVPSPSHVVGEALA